MGKRSLTLSCASLPLGLTAVLPLSTAVPTHRRGTGSGSVLLKATLCVSVDLNADLSGPKDTFSTRLLGFLLTLTLQVF